MMKLQIEQLTKGYTLEVLGDASDSQRHAFQSLQGVLLTIIQMCEPNDPGAKHVAIRQKYAARFTCIVEAMKLSGKEMTVNEVAIRTADLMGKQYSVHFQRGVAVALANAIVRPKAQIQRVGDLRSGIYRYHPEQVEP